MADETTVGMEPVSVEQDGRIFSGVGVSEDALAETMQARSKPAAEPAKPATEATAAEPDPATDEATEPDATPLQRDPATGQFKKPTRGQKRFAHLTAQREAAEQRATALEQRLAALEASRSQHAPETARMEPSAERKAPAAPQGRQKPTEDEIGSKYASYADFVEDLADWKAEQRFNQADQLIQSRFEQQHAEQTHVQRLQSVYERTMAAYPDFDNVRAANPASLSIEFPPAIWQAMLTAPNVEHLMYTLAQDAVLARKVADERDPIRLGYLLASVRPPERVARPASTPRTVTSNAPDPYQPVGTGSKTSTPSLQELAQSGEDYDASGYREKRAAERRNGVRR